VVKGQRGRDCLWRWIVLCGGLSRRSKYSSPRRGFSGKLWINDTLSFPIQSRSLPYNVHSVVAWDSGPPGTRPPTKCRLSVSWNRGPTRKTTSEPVPACCCPGPAVQELPEHVHTQATKGGVRGLFGPCVACVACVACVPACLRACVTL
jgi:hypothetical protein